MQFEWDGSTWYYDDRKVTVSVAGIIKKETGLNWPVDFAEALQSMDPNAIQALMWLVRQQNGRVEQISEVDGPIVPFMEAYAAGLTAEAAALVDPPMGAVEPVGDSPTTISGNSETAIS